MSLQVWIYNRTAGDILAAVHLTADLLGSIGELAPTNSGIGGTSDY
jgi:hypothetical protein